MNEASIEKKLSLKVIERGGLALKLISPGHAGVPDRLLLFSRARVVFVELKSPAKRLRALQQKRKQQLEDLGFRVYTVDGHDAIDLLLREIGL